MLLQELIYTYLHFSFLFCMNNVISILTTNDETNKTSQRRFVFVYVFFKYIYRPIYFF